MPRLYSFLIGINDYPPSVSSLSGCVNDCLAMHEYLSNYAALQTWDYSPLVLLNGQATRQAIIDGFQHFAKAKEGDICVWFYAGHGSRAPAPSAFWHQAPDQLHECLVCWDSRQAGGRELLDKEMSWLVWQATKGKRLHFLVLMDCCFSGTNLRMEGSQNRMAPKRQHATPLALEDYLGFADYHHIGGGKYSPPRGEYLQLAASRSNKPALEMFFDDGSHGIFTYALLKQLKETGRPVAYGELYQRIHAQVSVLSPQQSPQLDYTKPAFSRQLFLRQEKAMAGARHWVFFNRDKEHWILNMGEIDGVRADREGEASVVLSGVGHLARISETFSSFSIIEPVHPLSRYRVYSARIKKPALRMLSVALAPDFPATKRQMAITAFIETSLEYLVLVDTPESALFWVKCKKDQLGFYARNHQHPKFKEVGINQASLFWTHADMVARWSFLRQLSNSETQLPSNALTFELYQMETAVNYMDTSPKQEVLWTEPLRLHYRFLDGRWRYPAFQCRLTNTSDQTLWLGALFLSNNYGVMNNLLPKVELLAGEEIWLSFQWNQKETNIIRNGIEKGLFKAGITRNPETIKFIASTEEIFLDDYNQKGLLPPSPLVNRGPVEEDTPPRNALKLSDWTTYDIHLITCLPLETRFLSSDSPVEWFGHLLEAPLGFSALTSLHTLEDIEEQLSIYTLPDLGNSGDFTPYDWTPAFNRAPGLKVLGLEQVQGQLSSLHPLTISIPQELKASSFQPVALEANTGKLIRVSHSVKNEAIKLEQLPAFTLLHTGQQITLIFLHYLGQK